MAERDNQVRPFLVREKPETAVEALARLKAESSKIAHAALEELKGSLSEDAQQCAEASRFDEVSHGEREELRQVGEFITAALDRIAALRARNGR